jgi:hypothetical protein
MRRFTWLGALVFLVACQKTSQDGIANFDAWVDPRPSIPDAGLPTDTCTLDRRYEFFRDGGLRLFQDKSALLPPGEHQLSRDRRGGATPQSCVRSLPCDVTAMVLKAIAQRDVVEALKLATRPHYGSDPRPVDGTIFVFQRDDGHGFSVGPGTVPVGVRDLEQLLLKVADDSLASRECAALR